MDPRETLAAIAKAHAPCSSRNHEDLYTDVVIPPPDRTEPIKLNYFTRKPPSTCGLFACGVWRLAGLTDHEITGPYVIGTAIANIQNVAKRYNAWAPVQGVPSRLLRTGDVVLIDNGTGRDVHVMVVVGEPQDNKTFFTVDTVEGGQGPDSSGIEAFNRTFIRRGGRLYVGERFVIGYADPDPMPFPQPAILEVTNPAIGSDSTPNV